MLVVGITASRNRRPARDYIESLTRVGLTPEIITETSGLDDCCGLVLSGGGDISPALGGAEPVESVDEKRDGLEMRLVQLAVSRQVPILGICRGIQVLNVALGGTLRGHIEGHNGTEHEVRYLLPFPGDGVKIVNSLHHQCIHRLAPGLQAAAEAPDGVIEAVVGTNVTGVQWHPEKRRTFMPIFEDFSQRCILQKSQFNSMIKDSIK